MKIRSASRASILAWLVWAFFLLPLAHAGESSQEALPVNFFKHLQAEKQQSVVVYGTSLTALAEWPKKLKEHLDQQFPGQVIFTNAAQSGQHSNWGVTNLAARVLSRHPDLVFLEFSVNDAATKHHISTGQSAANLDTMVKALRAQNPQVDIVLMTMSPAWDSPNDPSGKKYASDRPHLEEYYGVYRQYAHDHGLPLVDLYPTWKKLQQTDEARFKQWLPEGIHPVPEASLAVTLPAIEALLEKARAAAARH